MKIESGSVFKYAGEKPTKEHPAEMCEKFITEVKPIGDSGVAIRIGDENGGYALLLSEKEAVSFGMKVSQCLSNKRLEEQRKKIEELWKGDIFKDLGL